MYGGGYRIFYRRAQGETLKERMARSWDAYVSLVGEDAVGSVTDVQRRRLALDQRLVQDIESKVQGTPAGQARAAKAAALMRIETSAKLVLFNAMRSTQIDRLVAPYGKVPTTDQWAVLPPELARAAGAGDPTSRALFDRPGTLAVVRPVWDRDELDWRLMALSPDGYLTIGSIEIESADAAGASPKHELPESADSLELELKLDRPHDDFLTLGSVATALLTQKRSFAAWCPTEYLIFRTSRGTLRALEEEPRRSPKFRFRDEGGGWIGIRSVPLPITVAVGIDWARTLLLLDRYDRGTLDLASLRASLKTLAPSQAMSQANVRYETQNLGREYDGLTEGMGLLKAALNSDWDPERDAPQKNSLVKTLPAQARGDIRRFLKSGRFVQDFPALFHPRTAFDVDQFLLERRVERTAEGTVLTVGLRSVLGTQRTELSQYRLKLAP